MLFSPCPIILLDSSSIAFYPSSQAKGAHWNTTSARVFLVPILEGPARTWFGASGWQQDGSEIQLRSELENSRIEGGCNCPEVVCDFSECRTLWVLIKAGRIAHLTELCVIPCVEAFRTEFQPAAAVVECKALE